MSNDHSIILLRSNNRKRQFCHRFRLRRMLLKLSHNSHITYNFGLIIFICIVYAKRYTSCITMVFTVQDELKVFYKTWSYCLFIFHSIYILIINSSSLFDFKFQSMTINDSLIEPLSCLNLHRYVSEMEIMSLNRIHSYLHLDLQMIRAWPLEALRRHNNTYTYLKHIYKFRTMKLVSITRYTNKYICLYI